MSKLQIIRIALNAAGVFVGSITASGTIGGEHGGIILAALAAASLTMRSIEAQLPKE